MEEKEENFLYRTWRGIRREHRVRGGHRAVVLLPHLEIYANVIIRIVGEKYELALCISIQGVFSPLKDS